MANLPTDIVNQALDALGWDVVIGDIEEGTREAQVALRAYYECLKQLLRAAHWNFARKEALLTMLADATGQTAGIGVMVPAPWLYEYAYPQDCLKARFIPANPMSIQPASPPGNISIGPQPMMTGNGQPVLNGMRTIPARFVESTDMNYIPELTGAWWEVENVSPGGQKVLLTNIQNAKLVYTSAEVYTNMWDPQFRAGLVAYLASEMALPLWASKDRKFGLEVRNAQIAIAKEKIKQARISDGNEGWSNTDHLPDWMQIRYSGPLQGRGYSPGGNGSIGVLGYGWDSCGFGDGSAY